MSVVKLMAALQPLAVPISFVPLQNFAIVNSD